MGCCLLTIDIIFMVYEILIYLQEMSILGSLCVG